MKGIFPTYAGVYSHIAMIYIYICKKQGMKHVH